MVLFQYMTADSILLTLFRHDVRPKFLRHKDLRALVYRHQLIHTEDRQSDEHHLTAVRLSDQTGIHFIYKIVLGNDLFAYLITMTVMFNKEKADTTIQEKTRYRRNFMTHLFVIVTGIFHKQYLCLNFARLVDLAVEGYPSKCHAIGNTIQDNLTLIYIL